MSVKCFFGHVERLSKTVYMAEVNGISHFSERNCTGPNEVYTNCIIACPPETCDYISAEYSCPERKCIPGCNCADRFLRSHLGSE